MQKQDKNSVVQITYNSCTNKKCSIDASLLDTKFSPKRSTLSYRRLIQYIQGFTYISLISDERPIFAVGTAKGSVSAIEVIKFSLTTKNFITTNITQYLKKSLQVHYSSQSWAWKIQTKTILQDQEKSSLLALIQYSLASQSLRGFFQKNKRKLSQDKILSIMQQLIQSLCAFQLDNTVIWDIRPQTIVRQNGRWFILQGDFAQKVTLQYGQPFIKPVIYKDLPRLYLSPSLLDGQPTTFHNPFKSDIYSLGLVGLQLQTTQILSKQQFVALLQNRKMLANQLSKYNIIFREKYMIKLNILYQIPDLLSIMLAQKQQDRWLALQIALIMDLSIFLMKKVVVPFQNFFKAQEIKLANKCKVSYSHSPHQYDGMLKPQYDPLALSTIRQGNGTMNFEFKKSYVGNWQNNLPNGRGNVIFSDSWKYDGNLKDGKLHQEGSLTFNGLRILQTKWQNNLPLKRVKKSQLGPCCGYYMFIQRQSLQVYYKKLHQKNIWIFNLFPIDFKSVLNHLMILLNERTICSIRLLEKQNNKIIHPTDYQCIVLQGNMQQVHIIVSKGVAKVLLLKLVQFQLFQKQKLVVNLSESSINQDDLLVFLKKPVKIERLLLKKCKYLSDKALRTICNYKSNGQLIELDLSGLDITDKGLHQIAFSSILDNLQELALNCCKNITTQKIVQLICLEKAKKIRRIQIQATSFNHNGLQKFIKFNSLQSLQVINIGLCHKINDAQVVLLLKSATAVHLKELILSSTILTDNVIQALGSEICSIKQLDHINFSGSINFRYSGLQRLFNSLYLDSSLTGHHNHPLHKIRTINLSSTQIDDRILRVLCWTQIFKSSVQELSLSGCHQITDKGIQDILKSKNFINLKKLDISKTNASNDTLYKIAQSSPPKKIINLNVSNCQKMNDNGFHKLIYSQSVLFLQEMNISQCGIQHQIFDALRQSKFAVCITKLNLSKCLKINQQALCLYISSSKFKKLNKLDLSGTLIHNSTLEVLNEHSLNFYRYVQVSLNDCKYLTLKGFQKFSIPFKFNSLIARNSSVRLDSLRELSVSETLLKMNELILNRLQNQQQLQQLFLSNYSQNLNSIKIYWSKLQLCFRQLSQSPHIKHLKEISLKGCDIDQQAFKQFLKSQNVTHLQVLDISWTQLSNGVIFTIVQSKFLKFLKQLRLSKCNNINDKGMQRFFSSKKCSILKKLDLRCTLLTNYTLQSLAYSPHLKNLKCLNIRACPNFKQLGVAQVFKSINSLSLKYVDFSWTNIGNDLFKQMRQSQFLTQLKEAVFSGMKNISDRGFCDWIKSKNCYNLHTLDISWTKLSDQSIKAICASQSLVQLQQLSIDNLQNVTQQGVRILLQNGKSQLLRVLDLSRLKLQGSQLSKMLVKEMKKLQKLSLHQIRGLNIDQLKKKLPYKTFIDYKSD